MTVASQYFSWQSLKTYPKAPWLASSPNLLLLHDYLVSMGMTSMGRGCYNPRPIRGGNAPSSHAYGAALDIKYTDRAELEKDTLPHLIAHSAELGIQRIHDYGAHRYWQAGRGWILRIPGQGVPTSLHIETHPDDWANTTPIGQRLDGPTPAPSWPKYPGRVTKKGSKGAYVRLVQAKVGVTVDGIYGPVTESAVKDWQASHGLQPDGLVGPLTWAAMSKGD